jgi:L-amino acid N-acyltransferase YncA
MPGGRAASSCGWKFGQWLDVVLMEKFLGAGDTTPAEEA